MGEISVSARGLQGFIDELIYTLSQIDTKKELDNIPDPNNDIPNTYFTNYNAIKELEDLQLISTGGKVFIWKDSECYTNFFPVQATLTIPRGIHVLEALKNEKVIAKMLSQSIERKLADIVEEALRFKQEIQDSILTY